MKHHNSALRICLAFVFVLLFSMIHLGADDVKTVVEQMRSVYEQQLEEVDTFIVETDRYTTYGRKTTQDGKQTYESRTKPKTGKNNPLNMSETSSTKTFPYGIDYDALKKHATYEGKQKVNGQTAHVLQVDQAAQVVNSAEGAENLKQATFFVDRITHVPIRIIIKASGMKAGLSRKKGKEQIATFIVDLKNYKIVDGFHYPHRTEVTIDMGLSKQKKKKIRQQLKQLENMPDKQKKMMKRMLGDNIGLIKRIISEEPIVSEVKELKVNVNLPDTAFPEK